MKLNIGAGITRIPDFTNIDVSSRADISMDMNHDRLPFDDNSVDLIFSNHTLEHLDEYLFALGEIHRVLKHGGKLLLGVPYVTLTEYNLVNPYHKQHFNEFSFDFFDPKRLLGSAAEENTIRFRKIVHRYHYLTEFAGETPEKQNWYRRHCFNVVKEIDFGILAIKDPAAPLMVHPDTPGKLLRLYDECKAARIPYAVR